MLRHMAADCVSYKLGIQAAVSAAHCAEGSLHEILKCCLSGCLRRDALLDALLVSAQTLNPLQLLHVLYSCVTSGIYGLHLLQVILPEPAALCSVILEACCAAAASERLCAVNAIKRHLSAAADRHLLGQPLQGQVQQFVQLLLMQHYDALLDEQQPCYTLMQQDTVLQHYVSAVLQHLQAASVQHQVLAICLYQAAAACVPVIGKAVPARWMRDLLVMQLSTAADVPPQSEVQHQSAVVQQTSWECLVLSHNCWSYIVPCLLECMQVEEVVQGLLPALQEAAQSARGLDRACAVFGAVKGAGWQYAAAVVHGLTQDLMAGLTAAALPAVLPPLLLAQQLLSPEEYSAALIAAASDLLLAKDAAAAGLDSWTCCIKSVRLTLPTANLHMLQAHLKMLSSCVTAAPSGSVKQEVTSAIEDLHSALASAKCKQEADAQPAAARLNTNYQLKLNMFAQQQPSATTGRRDVLDPYTGLLGAQWARQFAEALMQPPDDPYWARIRWEYLQGLEDRGLVSKKADKFKEMCHALGINIQGPVASLGAPPRGLAAGEAPVAVLTRLLASLPNAITEQLEQPMLQRVFNRISDVLSRVLQQQPLPPQQHLQPAVPPPAKRQHIDQLPCDAETLSSEGNTQQLLCQVTDLLLQAHDRTLAQPGGVDLTWRLSFLRLLQGCAGLHQLLVLQLLRSITGEQPDCNQARVCCHGRLLALMSLCSSSEVLVFSAGSDAVLLSQEVAAPAFTWHVYGVTGIEQQSKNGSTSTSTSSSNNNSSGTNGNLIGSGSSSGGSSGVWSAGCLTGLQLVQLVMSCTAMTTPHQSCCAASFWAGYVSELQRLQSWCPGCYGPFHLCNGQSQQQPVQWLGFVPFQLPALLQAVASQLAVDSATAALLDSHMVRAAQKACNGAIRSRPVKWVCQLAQQQPLQDC